MNKEDADGQLKKQTQASTSDTPVLQVEDLSKSYREVTALKDVSIEVNKKEVVGLVGENGAGKSTLLNILTGVISPDSGRILLRGEEKQFPSVTEAARNGISLVHQEQDIITNITGAENLFLGQEGDLTPFGYFNKERMIKRAKEELEKFGIAVDPSVRASELSFNERQLLEIARALTIVQSADTPIILLDEPTAGLEEESRELLFDLIDSLKSDVSFIFVSHELDEVISVSDRIYVLKDGELVSEVEAKEATVDTLQKSMVGRSSTKDFYKVSRQMQEDELGEVVLSVDSIQNDEISPVSFDLRRGEILGIVGVDGSGKEQLGQMLYGASPVASGSVKINGEEYHPSSTQQMKRAGIGYIPKDRKSDGLLLYQSVTHNISLAIVDRLLNHGYLLDTSSEKSIAKDSVDDLNIKTPGIGSLVHSLSGGNQQKVVLSRWLARNCPVLIADNITRGIDVGAKEEVYTLCRDLVEEGSAMIFIGDELQEVIGLSNRIGVMYKGDMIEIIDSPPKGKPNEEVIIEKMI